VRLPSATEQTDLLPAPIYDVSKLTDKRTQTLRKLLEKGHITVAPLREPEFIFHSHLPHVSSHVELKVCHRRLPLTSTQLLGSAYGLGADSNQLTATYEHAIDTLVNIDGTFVRGDKITKQDWRQFLQDKKCVPVCLDGWIGAAAKSALDTQLLMWTSSMRRSGQRTVIGRPLCRSICTLAQNH